MTNGAYVRQALADFRRAWIKLAEQSKCDGPDGGEYTRVFAEWLESDCPDPEPFIEWRANVGPNDEGWSA